MKNSSIQWCDHTFNPWIGCTKVAPECKNCYRRNEIAPFVKQLGSKPMEYSMKGSENDGYYQLRLKDSHGGDPSEWPEDLRVREFPRVDSVLLT